jgi:large subunit ribosomal protein L10
MERTEKEKIVAELTEQLRTAQSLIVADYRGLSVKEIDALRTRLLEHGASFQVVKNTLTRRAAEAAGADVVLALLEGPTAIAFLESDGDPVAVAKALTDTARTTRVLTIRGGILEGRQIGEEDIRNLATLPPADVLQAQIVGAIAGPLITIVGLFTAPLRDLVGVLDARIRQLGDSAAAESPSETTSAQAEPVREDTEEEESENGN